MKTILTAENIHKVFQTKSGTVNVLNGISFEFKKGETYSIMGRSGSGKSTFLNILASLTRPTQGIVRFGDQDIYSFKDQQMSEFRRRHIGFVFQQYNLIEEYNVLTNICLPLKLDKRKPDEAFLKEIVEMLGISDKLQKYPYELSGGEQQRVAIARSLIARPEILFADEPTGNLDRLTEEKTIQLLCECVEQIGQTLILVTHNPEIAARMKHQLIMDDGRLTQLS